MENIAKIFEFVSFIHKLKFEMRYSGIDKADTVGAHSWSMTVLTYLIAKELDIGLDVDKCVKISLVHDFPESVTNDLDYKIAYKDPGKVLEKEKNEETAMKKLADMLPKHLGDEIYELSLEYRNASTPEARFVKIMDKMECVPQIIFMGLENFDADRLDAAESHSRKGFGWFPEVDKVINFFRDKEKQEFIKHGFEWKPEWDLKN